MGFGCTASSKNTSQFQCSEIGIAKEDEETRYF